MPFIHPLIHPRDIELQGVEPQIHLQLMDIQRSNGLSDCEMIEVLHNFTAKKISRFIKREREEA